MTEATFTVGEDGAWSAPPSAEGQEAQPWYAGIEDESVRSTVQEAGYNNPYTLASAYATLRSERGNGVQLPGEGATPEDMNAFYGALGRPEAPEGYEFKFGDDTTPDDGMVKFAQTAFHKAGLTPSQAQTVAEAWNEFADSTVSAAGEASAEQNAQALQSLESKYGAEAPALKVAGGKAIAALGLDDAHLQSLESTTSSAAVAELMMLIGKGMGEGAFVGDGSGGRADPDDPSSMTPQQVAAEIAKLNGDAEFQKKYVDAAHPEHREAVKRMEALFKHA